MYPKKSVAIYLIYKNSESMSQSIYFSVYQFTLEPAVNYTLNENTEFLRFFGIEPLTIAFWRNFHSSTFKQTHEGLTAVEDI